jgi:putative phage-type endonuclease
MITVELVQGSPEWHAWRKIHLGGSDAPVVANISPYKTPRELYLEKTGAPSFSEDDGNEFIFAKGHKAEKLIRTQFQELTGVEMKPLCVVHAKHGFMAASLDGFDHNIGVLEAKLVGQEVLERARNGEIPHHHACQLQHNMEVADHDRGQWFGHDGKKNGVLIEVKRDRDYGRGLVEIEERFMETVRLRMPPPLTMRDYLIPEDRKLLDELREAKIQAENAQEYFEQLKAKAAETYKHPKIAGEGVKLYLVEKSGSVSWTDIPEIAAAIEAAKSQLKPEYIEKFRKKASASWTLKIDKVAKG